MSASLGFKRDKQGVISGDGSRVPVETLDGSRVMLTVLPSTTTSAAAAAVVRELDLPSIASYALHELRDNTLATALAPDLTMKEAVHEWTRADFESGAVKFILKRTVFLKDQAVMQAELETTEKKDSKADMTAYQSLAYGEAKWNLLSGNYRFPPNTLVPLAALALTIDTDCSNLSSASVLDKLPSITPSYAHSTTGSIKPSEISAPKDAPSKDELCKQILEAYSQYRSKPVDDALFEYLKLCQPVSGYGGEFFAARRTWKTKDEDTPSAKMKARTEDVRVCVGGEGILLLSMDEPLLAESHEFEVITKWTVSRDGKIFAFSIDDSVIIYLVGSSSADIEACVERCVALIVADRTGSDPPATAVVGALPKVVDSTKAVDSRPSRVAVSEPAAGGAAGAGAGAAPANTPVDTNSTASPAAEAAAAAVVVAAKEEDSASGDKAAASDTASPKALPPNWSEVTDDDGDVFFYNSETGESSWTRPEAQAASGEGSPKAGAPVPATVAGTTPKDDDDEDDPFNTLPAGWEAHQDDEGDTFYVNKTSGEAVWERPTQPAEGYVLGGDAAADAAAAADLPEGWEAHQDDDGDTFYVNTVSGESVWEKPTEPATA